MKRIFVRPTRKGLIVRDPKNKRPIPVEGKYVIENTYWRRRINDKDIEIVAKPKIIEKTEKVSSDKLK